MPDLLLFEVTKSTIPFIAGYLAGRADRRFGPKEKNWVMKIYADLRAGKGSIEWLHKLEADIKRKWPEGETPPSIPDVLTTPQQVQH